MLFVYISIHISIQMIKLTSAATYIYNAYVICVYIYKYIYKYTENKLISAAIYTHIYILRIV